MLKKLVNHLLVSTIYNNDNNHDNDDDNNNSTNTGNNFQLSLSTDNNVAVAFKSGFPVISVPLPSRRERCEFTLRPLSHTVRDFLHDIQQEDKGIERAMVYNEDGSRISGSTGVDVLLQSNFKLVLNEDSYLVSVPDESKCY